MDSCRSRQALEEIPFPYNATTYVPWSDNILVFHFTGTSFLAVQNPRSQRLTRKIHETLVRVLLIFTLLIPWDLDPRWDI